MKSNTFEFPNFMIGGAHRLASREKKWSEPKDYKVAYTANARSAIYVAFKMCDPPTVWMPNYLCPSVLHKEFPTKFYRVDNHLRSELPKAQAGDLVVAIEYFGRPICSQFEQHVKNCEALLLKDKSQSLFSSPSGDFAIYSLTKQVGFPDGGLLYHNQADIPLNSVPLDPAYMSYREKRTKFDDGEDNNWYQVYLQAKKITKPFGLFSMSQYTRENLGIHNRSAICRSNYEILKTRLRPLIEDNENPSGFPVISDNRDWLQKELAKKKIYCPIHWDIQHELSRKILTIPCDWRYNEEHMEYIINANQELHSDILHQK